MSSGARRRKAKKLVLNVKKESVSTFQNNMQEATT
jgi:hypothetical protein